MHPPRADQFLQRENNSFWQVLYLPLLVQWELRRGSQQEAPPLGTVILTQSCFQPFLPIWKSCGCWQKWGGSLPWCHVKMWVSGLPVLWSFTGSVFSAWFLTPRSGPILPLQRVVRGKSEFSLESSTRHLEYNFRCPLRLVTTYPSALCLSYFFAHFIICLILTQFWDWKEINKRSHATILNQK